MYFYECHTIMFQNDEQRPQRNEQVKTVDIIIIQVSQVRKLKKLNLKNRKRLKHDRVNELLTRLLSLLRNTLTIIIIIPSRILLLLYSLFDTAVLLCLFLIYIYIFTGMLVILQSIAYVSCHIYSRLSVTFFLTYQIR